MFNFIRNIFIGIFKLLNWTRVIVINLLFLFIVILIIQAVSGSKPIEIPNKSLLVIAPSGALVDQASTNFDTAELLGGSSDRKKETVVHNVIKAIRAATNDPQITGLYLRLDFLEQAGMSKTEEIGQAIEYFKQSKKPVLASADNFSQQQYYLASYADEIFLHDLGGIYLTGFGSYRNYLKEAADKLAITFHVFRAGQFKDAVEPFMRNSMSEQSREHNRVWLEQLWNRYTDGVEERRGLETGTVKKYVENLDVALSAAGGNASKHALDSGLISRIFSRTELREYLKERFGVNSDDAVNAIAMAAYLNNPLQLKPTQHPDKIGLLIAAGNIVGGHQPAATIGAETLISLIRQAREKEDLKALVIRVDSPGGSAFASELIREEVALTRESGLPVYISMGSVAASGGYWISMASDGVWATPTTITGSIGVFALVPNVTESLSKLGIHTDGVGTSPLADAFRIDRPIADEAKRVIQSGVDNIYQRFLKLVADARNSTPEKINTVAQGRVWTGIAAKDLGLVDALGTLDDLVKHVGETLNLEKYSLKLIEKELSPKEKLVQTLMENTNAIVNSSLANNALFKDGVLLKKIYTHSRAGNTLSPFSSQMEALSTSEHMHMQTFSLCFGCNQVP